MSMENFLGMGAPGNVPPRDYGPVDARAVPQQAPTDQQQAQAWNAAGQPPGVPASAFETPALPGASFDAPIPQPPRPTGMQRLTPAVSDMQVQAYQQMLGTAGPLPESLINMHRRFKLLHDRLGSGVGIVPPAAAAFMAFFAEIHMQLSGFAAWQKDVDAKLTDLAGVPQPQAPAGLRDAPIQPSPPAPPQVAQPTAGAITMSGATAVQVAPEVAAPPPAQAAPEPQAPAGLSLPAPEVPELGSLCLEDGTIIVPGNAVMAKWRKGGHRVAQFVEVDPKDDRFCILNFTGKQERVPWRGRVKAMPAQEGGADK